jgi:hypothetical protein
MLNSNCRLCLLRHQALKGLERERVYAFLKNELSLLGYVGFEAELYRFVEELAK